MEPHETEQPPLRSLARASSPRPMISRPLMVPVAQCPGRAACGGPRGPAAERSCRGDRPVAITRLESVESVAMSRTVSSPTVTEHRAPPCSAGRAGGLKDWNAKADTRRNEHDRLLQGARNCLLAGPARAVAHPIGAHSPTGDGRVWNGGQLWCPPHAPAGALPVWASGTAAHADLVPGMAGGLDARHIPGREQRRSEC